MADTVPGLSILSPYFILTAALRCNIATLKTSKRTKLFTESEAREIFYFCQKPEKSLKSFSRKLFFKRYCIC